jgi:thiosulfate dehydrogenase [quinone] large subunit
MEYLRTLWQVKDPALWLALLRVYTGWIFLASGWGKVTDAGFIDGLPGTLGYFASQNPYPWMQRLLQTVAIPNAGLFGLLIAWGELLVGLSLLFGVLSQLGLLGGLALNLTFFFAAGWTGPGTATANKVMIVAQAVMFLAVAGKVLSVDQLLYRRFPRLLPRWVRAEQPTI